VNARPRSIPSARRAAAACLLVLLAAATPRVAAQQTGVLTGADVLLRDSLSLVAGLRAGIVCNRASALADGTPVWQALRASGAATVVALFAPEHGMDGLAANGEAVGNGARDSLPVYSLYGDVKKPTPGMLRGLDVLLIDLQDVGARYYTFASTMLLCMEAAAECGVRCVVLDRPNPIGGAEVEGPVMDASLRSFVGLLPVPVRHGMTLGELARMAVGAQWFPRARQLRLHVVPMRHWRRRMHFSETGLRWIAPSPGMPSPETAETYPGTCLFEGTNISEGRGTATPFRVFGAPFMHEDSVATRLSALGIAGVEFRPAVFVPAPAPGSGRPKFAGDTCRGAMLRVTDARVFQPVRAAVLMLAALRGLYGRHCTATPFLDRLSGVPGLFERCADARAASGLLASWGDGVASFLRARAPYLLYTDL
jgi:uncharacterized protein YbbC (DUF1343 family)